MKPQPFETNVRRTDGVITIDLIGEINAFAETNLLEAYQKAQISNPGVIILNFSGVSYINSTGIALIVGLLSQARKSRRKLVVYGLSDHYVRIFQITRLSDFMTIYPDEETALLSAADAV